MSREEELLRIINKFNDNDNIHNFETVVSVMLMEIAHSLAVIADKITEEQEHE